jgi:hypothetical protein
MFGFFRRMKKKIDVPAAAPSGDFVVRHQIECGPFNTARVRADRY